MSALLTVCVAAAIGDAGDAGEVGVVGDLVIVLAGAGLTALIMRRCGLAVIPAFLVAGVALGPHALALVPAPDQLRPISHLAIVILLFGIGLELHLSALRGRVVQLLSAALLACGICVAAGWALAMAWGLDSARALLIGMALSLSSTAVVLKYLAARRELTNPIGRLSIAILVVQDLAVVAMLAALPLLARNAGIVIEEGAAFSDALDVLWRLGAIAAGMALSRWLMAPLLRESLQAGQTELLLLVGLAYALAAAWATHLLGFSLEMGAFLAGFVLSGTRFRHQLAGQVVPIRDLFLAVFFTTLGMQLDPAIIAANVWVVLGATATLLVGKSVLIALSCWLAGAPASISAAAGLSLAQAGEFSLVLLGAAAAMGLLPAQLGAILIGVVVLSLLSTPALATVGRAAARRLVDVPRAPWAARAAGRSDALDAPSQGPEVIIAGFGPVGRRVALDLEEDGVDYTVIELNSQTVEALRAQGRRSVLGDVGNETVLREAGLVGARALVVALPDAQATVRACLLARRLHDPVIIAARANLQRDVAAIRAAGADHVVVDEIASGDDLAQTVVAHIRSPAQPADAPA